MDCFPPRQIPALSDFDSAADEGRLLRRTDGDLVSFIYSKRTFYSGFHDGWAEIDACGRGIVFRRSTGDLIALPFPKFFNLGENKQVSLEALPREPIQVVDKVDGTLMIVFYDGERWRASTKGSLSGPHARWGEEWVRQNLPVSTLDRYRDFTLLFEAVYPSGTFEDDLVIDYGDREDFTLLAAYHVPSRAEVMPHVADEIAADIGVLRPQVFSFGSLEEVAEAARVMDHLETEGFVVQFMHSGLRVKVKGAGYLRASKILWGVTLIGLWESMNSDGKVDRTVVSAVPEHRRDDIESEINALESLYQFVRWRVDTLAKQASQFAEGKERASFVTAHAGPLAGLVFAAARGKGDNVHRGVLDRIYPKGNQMLSLEQAIGMK